jgi:hypothetical protein
MKELMYFLSQQNALVHFLCTGERILPEDFGIDLFEYVEALARDGQAGEDAQALLTALIARPDKQRVLARVLSADDRRQFTAAQLALVIQIRALVLQAQPRAL